MVIKLYDYFRSSASYRVRIALNLKGLSYEAIDTSLLDGAHKEPEHLQRNPQGFVPSLDVDGMIINQSFAIIDWLDARYPSPRLIPVDPDKRAQTLAQAMVIIADIHPVNNLRILKYLKQELGANQEQVDTWYRHWIREGFTALEAMAPDTHFFGGDQPNLTDICLVPQMYNARRIETEIDDFPKLRRIDEACRAIDAIIMASPEAVQQS